MPVTIRRDDWGMPHVDADSERECFFGIGWAQAEDHLERLLQTYAVLAGRGTDALGPRGALLDAAQHRWRHLEQCRDAVVRLPTAVRGAHEAFVAGVQAYLDAHPSEVPAWAPALEPALPLAVYRMHLWPVYMVGDALKIAQAAGAVLDEDIVREILAADPDEGASNAAFVAPERTADGGAVLLSDPHGSISGFPMSEVRFRGGSLDAVGVCAIGAAIPMLGHTRRLAWAMTTGAPQVSDAYFFRNPKVTRRTAVISGREVVVEEVEHAGAQRVVIGHDAERTYAAVTTYGDVAGVLESELYGLLTAADVHAARSALETLGMFPQNLLMVDADGGCVYVRAGRTPRRSPGVDPARPVDGDDPATVWQGVHPLADLVQIESPPLGWFQVDNVSPDTAYDGADSGPLRADRYPPYVFNDRPGRTHGRGERHKDLLRAFTRADQEQLRLLATDDYWPGTAAWQKALLAAAEEQVAEPPALVPTLLAFDGHAAPESSAALAWWYWRTTLGTLDGHSPEEIRELVRRVDRSTETEDDRAVLLTAATAAAQRMALDGTTAATFGDRFRVGIGGASFPARGISFPAHAPTLMLEHVDIVSPVRMMLAGEPDDNGVRWVHTGGRSLRLVQFTSPIRSQSVVLFGQSTRSGSPHASDQAKLYAQAQLRSTYFEDAELRDHVVSTITLQVPPAAP